MRKRSKYRPKPVVADCIAHAIAGAAITDTASLDKLRLAELSAIEAFRTGRAGRDDWTALADMCNICETMANSGIGPETLEPCLVAQEALSAAHERHTRTGRIGVTGPELEALRQAQQWHDLQRMSVSRQSYEQAIQRTANRIRSAAPDIKVCI